MKIRHCTILLISLLTIASCKVRVVVPEGGSVTTQSGAYDCAAGKTCNIDIVDFFFDQTFVAKPAQDYRFKFWRKGDRRFCGVSSEPCRLFTTGLDANADLAGAMRSFFESDEVFYLQPVFEKKATANDCTPAAASYSLTISGGETAQLGTSLKTGDLAFGREDLTGPIDALIIVDKCSTISDTPAAFPPGDPRNTASINPADPDNTFVMVVSKAAISMAIVKNAVSYTYACDSDFNIFRDCGGLDFDVATRTLNLNNVTVENTDTASVLTINGQVTWNN